MAVITAGQTLPEVDDSIEVDLVTNAAPMTPSASAQRRSRVPLIAAFVGLIVVGVVVWLALTRATAPAPAPSAAPRSA